MNTIVLDESLLAGQRSLDCANSDDAAKIDARLIIHQKPKKTARTYNVYTGCLSKKNQKQLYGQQRK